MPHFSVLLLANIWRRAGNEQMKIEQGMSKEEVRGLSEEMAAKNANNRKERYKLTYLRI